MLGFPANQSTIYCAENLKYTDKITSGWTLSSGVGSPGGMTGMVWEGADVRGKALLRQQSNITQLLFFKSFDTNTNVCTSICHKAQILEIFEGSDFVGRRVAKTTNSTIFRTLARK